MTSGFPPHTLGHGGRHERGRAPDQQSAPAPTPGRAGLTTLVACLGLMTAYLPFTGTTTALPTIALQLHASTSDLQWVSDLFVIAMAAAVLPAGVFGDVHGRKRVFVTGLGLTAVGSAVGLAAHQVQVLWIAETLMGLGAAAVLPTSLALISHAVPDPRVRGRHIAALGRSLRGRLGAGGLVGHAQWRWIFIPVLAMAAVSLLIAVLALTEAGAPGSRALDWY